MQNKSFERESSEVIEKVVGESESTEFEASEASTRSEAGEEVVGESHLIGRGEMRASGAKAKRESFDSGRDHCEEGVNLSKGFSRIGWVEFERQFEVFESGRSERGFRGKDVEEKQRDCEGKERRREN